MVSKHEFLDILATHQRKMLILRGNIKPIKNNSAKDRINASDLIIFQNIWKS